MTMKELSSLQSGTIKKKTVEKPAELSLKKTKKHDLRPLYTFFITLVLYAAAMLLCNKYPFGEYSFLQSDLKAQYAPFLALLKSKILEAGSVPKEHFLSYLSYSFQLGLGKNFMSTFGYYLSSPFNLLYLFIDTAQTDAVVLLIVTLKLSLSSGFMCLFLGKRTGDRKSFLPVLFGICYAFSLYSQAFLFQIMWLDGYMLLPLILYFTEKFIKERKYAGLVVSLLVLFISNYYIAYMAGIACFIYLVVRMITVKIPVREALGTAGRYLLTAVFTALVTAVMLIPVGLDTIRNSDQSIVDQSENYITYQPLVIVHMLFSGENGEFKDVLPSNYPFLFICLPVSLLLMIYFISPVFKGRERKVHLVCLIGAILSTFLYLPDKAWQVFDDPNWFWHRQAFVFLPLLLVIAIKTLLKIKEVVRKDIVKAMVIMLLLLVIDFSFGRMAGDSQALVYNLALILTYSLIMIGYGVEKWPEQLSDMNKMITPVFGVILVFELVFVGPMLTSKFQTMTLFGGMAQEYSDSIRAVEQFSDYAGKYSSQNGAFRAETEKVPEYTKTYYVDAGEAFYGNYNGVSFFNSNSNKPMQRFIKQLGMPANYNYFAVDHTFACPSCDAFLSVGAVGSRRDMTFYRYDGVDSYGSELKFFYNEDVLPLGFAADKEAMSFDYYRLEKDPEVKDYYALQNDWYRSMFPDAFENDFFKEIGEDITGKPVITNGVFFKTGDYMMNEELLSKGDPDRESKSLIEDPLGLEGSVAAELKDNMTDIYRVNSKIPIAVEYTFKAPSSDEIYCSLVTGRILDGTEVYVNGIQISSIKANAYYSQLFRIGSFEEGETVKVTFLSEDARWSYLNVRFAGFDYEAFKSQFAKVNRTKVTTEEVCDGYVRFSVNGLGSDELVLTTIPAEDGWQLYVDGKPAEYKVYQNAFIAIDAGEGSHTAELVFTAPGLKTGAAVSLAGVLALAAFILIDKKCSKKKAK